MTRLRQIREDMGLTQEQFAALVGCQRSTICRLELGVRRPSLDLIERLVRATNGRLSADDFIIKAAA